MTDPSRVSLLESVRVDCTMADRGLPFYEWRNSPTFVMAMRRELFSRFDVRIAGDTREPLICVRG